MSSALARRRKVALFTARVIPVTPDGRLLQLPVMDDQHDDEHDQDADEDDDDAEHQPRGGRLSPVCVTTLPPIESSIFRIAWLNASTWSSCAPLGKFAISSM